MLGDCSEKGSVLSHETLEGSGSEGARFDQMTANFSATLCDDSVYSEGKGASLEINGDRLRKYLEDHSAELFQLVGVDVLSKYPLEKSI